MEKCFAAEKFLDFINFHHKPFCLLPFHSKFMRKMEEKMGLCKLLSFFFHYICILWFSLNTHLKKVCILRKNVHCSCLVIYIKDHNRPLGLRYWKWICSSCKIRCSKVCVRVFDGITVSYWMLIIHKNSFMQYELCGGLVSGGPQVLIFSVILCYTCRQLFLFLPLIIVWLTCWKYFICAWGCIICFNLWFQKQGKCVW